MTDASEGSPWNPAHNVYISHSHQLLVFWSQKAACGAVSLWFSAAVLQREMSRDALRLSNQCIPYGDAMQYIGRGYTTMFACRNPYQRSVSAYINKFYYHSRRGALDELGKLAGFSRKLYLNSGVSEHYCGWGFEAYLRAVRRAMFKNKVINGHWDTQLPRNCSSRFQPDFLLRVENFSDDLRRVNLALGLDDYVPEMDNQTTYDETFRESTEMLDKVSSLELLKARIALRPHNLLSEDSKKLIRRLYAEDFSYFGYDTD